ncbi:MAG: Mov34/MPN/PAD-1 family protein [Parasphingorhabdus sp.]|nr:Mov34/MPN/PAD-1 family protein [Sphingorhabdus sp. YGSMI21]ATW03229.1 hypothetical protein CHN51_06480 [Sphingorhabdus sp. YGSMI21]
MPDAGPLHAEKLLRIAAAHPEFASGKIQDDKLVRIELKVEMPIAYKADNISVTGVRTVEPVMLHLPDDYPWKSPRVTLRDDFPRHFPHLLPGPNTSPPRPCLIDGDPDEFFLQYGLVEYGVYNLIEQLAVWLRKAAIDHLNDPAHGWEPMLRREMRSILICDAQAARKTVTKSGGCVIWGAEYIRYGKGGSAGFLITSDAERKPLDRKDKNQFAYSEADGRGNTIAAVIWPDKQPDGRPHICDQYSPEDVSMLGDLRRRAKIYGCSRGLDMLLSNLDRRWNKRVLGATVPIAIILCVRRPFPLVHSDSCIELLPYMLEINPCENRTELIGGGEDGPVEPIAHVQSLTGELLRTMSDVPERPSLAILGCGSVGSKLALHAVRAGQSITAISDAGWLRPHNMARHAAGADRVFSEKADALAKELFPFGQVPAVNNGDIAAGLRTESIRPNLVPKNTGMAINATGSLSVREAIAASAVPRERTRYAEAALFGKGRIGYLFVDGKGHNPSHCDLIAEFYASCDDPEAMKLISDPDFGLEQVQIGQGCGSLTMAIDDAQISMMTAGLFRQIGHSCDQLANEGLLVVGVSEPDTPATRWQRRLVAPFETVMIEESGGWQLRIAPQIADRIRSEAKDFHSAETGGLLIGLSSERLKTVTVVDLLNAPPDSTRSASLFVLGKEGLKDAIEQRHEMSGKTLFDVGTWHSHLSDEGPSVVDWQTAADLKVDRTPPSVLLIVTPRRFHAILGKDNNGERA